MDWSGWALFGLVATMVLTALMIADQMTAGPGWTVGSMLAEDPDHALGWLTSHISASGTLSRSATPPWSPY